MTARELAWRVFAAELHASTSVQRGEGEKAPTYLLSPFGGRINRVLMAGRLEAPTALDGGTGVLGASLSDPTGTIGVSSGTFLPRGHEQLSRLRESTEVLLVGKAGRRPGGTGDAFVRVEGIRRVSDDDLRTVQAEILLQSAQRLRITELGWDGRGDAPPGTGPRSRPRWRSDLPVSRSAYPRPDFAGQLHHLREVLDVLEGRRPPPPPVSVSSRGPTRSTVTITRSPRPGTTESSTAPSAAVRALESAFLDVVDQLGEESIDGYAELRSVIERCAAIGIDERTVEDLLNRLEESGAVEEPIVGRLRRA